jgi:Phosphodiester glycosidase
MAALEPSYARLMDDGIRYELTRVRLRDGVETTVYLVRHPLAMTSLRVIHFPEPRRLDHWCAAHGEPEAMVAGFFLRDPYRPLGEVRIGGEVVAHEPASPPWGPKRGCVHIDGEVRIAPREQVADDPSGDLVQAGPLLVSGGRSLVDGEDREGFSSGASQFDSDITMGRYPRCALGLSETELLAVCCDGRRSGVDGGLELAELARLLISFGAEEAINLDGGGSATLVHRMHLLNRPYSDYDQPAPESRPVVTALIFDRTPRPRQSVHDHLQ